MSGRSQVAYMLIADDSEQLKSELATTVGWPQLLGFATDVRIGAVTVAVVVTAAAEGDAV
jgi:hypothetical protein